MKIQYCIIKKVNLILMNGFNKKKNIFYISTVCSPKLLDNIFKTATVKPGQAVQKFHRLLIEGFAFNKIECSVDVLSSLPVTTVSHQKRWWAIEDDVYKGITFKYIPFLNFYFFKHLFVFAVTFYRVIIWSYKNRMQDKVVICDILNNGIVWSTFLACKIVNQKMVVLVTDLPTMLIKSNPKPSILSKMIESLSMFFLRRFDYYVILTEQMNEIVNPYGKPFLIMEGLVDAEVNSVENSDFYSGCINKRILLYAGGIYEKYGVKKLLDAFSILKEEDIELHIYGSGDLENIIQEYCSRDFRIKYFGIVTNDIVVKRLKEATLLVNPRPTDEEFTKYSFPSKNMEYMVSGTPLLTTKLPGMPSEYNSYVYLFDDQTVYGIKNTIENLLSKSSMELKLLGTSGQQFVLDNKSNRIQSKRIIDFLNEK